MFFTKDLRGLQQKMIRKAADADAGRMAEIIVYNNRINFYPIFGDIEYSFKEFNVLDVCRSFLDDRQFMDGAWVFEDKVVKGFVSCKGGEIVKLYVDSFFQSEGIGGKLLDHAVERLGAEWLWALEKNTRAVEFYKKHGFEPNGEKTYEEGTTEYLVKLVKTR